MHGMRYCCFRAAESSDALLGCSGNRSGTGYVISHRCRGPYDRVMRGARAYSCMYDILLNAPREAIVPLDMSWDCATPRSQGRLVFAFAIILNLLHTGKVFIVVSFRVQRFQEHGFRSRQAYHARRGMPYQLLHTPQIFALASAEPPS